MVWTRGEEAMRKAQEALDERARTLLVNAALGPDKGRGRVSHEARAALCEELAALLGEELTISDEELRFVTDGIRIFAEAGRGAVEWERHSALLGWATFIKGSH